MKIKTILLAIWGVITAALAAVISFFAFKSDKLSNENKTLADELEREKEKNSVSNKMNQIQKEEDEKTNHIVSDIHNGEPISDIMSKLKADSDSRNGVHNQ